MFITNVHRKQAYKSIMCGYFCIGVIDFIWHNKSLTYFTNLFSPYDSKKMKKNNIEMFTIV